MINMKYAFVLSFLLSFGVQTLFAAESAEDAKRFYEKVVLTQPANANAHFDLGNVYLSENRYNDALDQYEKAGAIGLASSRMGSYYFNKSVCFAGLGRMHDAVDCMEKSIKADPGNKQAEELLCIYKNRT